MSDIFAGAETHMWSLANGKGGTSIKSVQRGLATMNSITTTNNVVITAVDTTASFVIVSTGSGTSPSPPALNSLSVSARLTTGTNLQLFRQVHGSSNVSIQWTVIEFSGAAKVQQVISAMSASTLDVAITAVDLSKTFLVHNWDDASTSASTQIGSDRVIRPSLTTATNLHLERTAASGAANVVTFIVELK